MKETWEGPVSGQNLGLENKIIVIMSGQVTASNMMRGIIHNISGSKIQRYVQAFEFDVQISMNHTLLWD